MFDKHRPFPSVFEFCPWPLHYMSIVTSWVSTATIWYGGYMAKIVGAMSQRMGLFHHCYSHKSQPLTPLPIHFLYNYLWSVNQTCSPFFQFFMGQPQPPVCDGSIQHLHHISWLNPQQGSWALKDGETSRRSMKSGRWRTLVEKLESFFAQSKEISMEFWWDIL